MKNRGQPSYPLPFPTTEERDDAAVYIRCCMNVLKKLNDAPNGKWYSTEVITDSNNPGEIYNLYEDAKEFFDELKTSHLLDNSSEDPNLWEITTFGREMLAYYEQAQTPLSFEKTGHKNDGLKALQTLLDKFQEANSNK